MYPCREHINITLSNYCQHIVMAYQAEILGPVFRPSLSFCWILNTLLEQVDALKVQAVAYLPIIIVHSFVGMHFSQ